jgi:hypothetical protein
MEATKKAAELKQKQMADRIVKEKAAFVKAKARREKAAADALEQAKKEYEAEM